MSLRTIALATAVAALLPATAMAASGDRGARMEQFMQQRFAELDTNRDGKVDQAEIDAHRSARFAAADRNRDGAIDQSEYEEMVLEMRRKAIAARFQRSDQDKDGRITPAEFGSKPVQGLMRLDADNDGGVTLDEMREAWSKRHGKRHGN